MQIAQRPLLMYDDIFLHTVLIDNDCDDDDDGSDDNHLIAN